MAQENRTTVKRRKARIPLDYFRRGSTLENWKRNLAIVAIVAVAGYLGWCAVGAGSSQQYSPGQVAACHAMWNNRCEVCHQSFVPVGSGAWSGDPHASDQLCQACHRGAEHSSRQIAAEVSSCAACHREHEGEMADLIRVADTTCSSCHANIAAHTQSGGNPMQPPLVNVTSFLSDHPEFRSVRRAADQIKFSHSRHTRPGLTFGLNPMKLSDLAPEDRERYRADGQNDGDLVTLNCSSCHQLDQRGQQVTIADSSAKRSTMGAVTTSGVAPDLGGGPVRPSGDYMLPISFELHCQACHQLSYAGRAQLNVSEKETPRYQSVNSNDVVPHGWSDEQSRRYLEQVLAMKFVSGLDKDALQAPLSQVLQEPLAKWRLPNREPQAQKPNQTVGEYLNAELKAAVSNAQRQCAECHQLSGELESLAVQPVSSRAAWFEHARFSHVAHRAVTCQSCHAGAFPEELPTEPTAVKTLDDKAMIPARKLCLECHSPVQDGRDGSTGGARFDCVECHRYHQGDQPWHGAGNPAVGAPRRVSVEDFIEGKMREEKAK